MTCDTYAFVCMCMHFMHLRRIYGFAQPGLNDVQHLHKSIADHQVQLAHLLILWPHVCHSNASEFHVAVSWTILHTDRSRYEQKIKTEKLLMSEDKRSKLYIACFSSLLAKGPLSWLLECTAEPAQGRHRLTMCKFAVRKSYGRCKEKPWIQAQSSQTRYCTYLEVS